MPHNVGYCCINTTLQKKKITTGRAMRKATFEAKGLKYASELALANANDLLTILKWNADNGVKVFRMGSGIFPWGTEYKETHLPDYFAIVSKLKECGDFAKATGQRITAHPDHFVKLGSEKESVVLNSIKDLELHSTVFDYMGLEASPYNAINIHATVYISTYRAWYSTYLRLFSSPVSFRWINHTRRCRTFRWNLARRYHSIVSL